MRPLNILITNVTLAERSGTVLYVRDLARELIRRGHHPTVYSPTLGLEADDVRRTTAPVVDSLGEIATPPDVIHAHHTLPAVTALVHFPTTPGIFVCHDAHAPWDEPPPLARFRRVVAVDENCADRLRSRHAIGPDRLRVILNSVDLDLFRRREPLPARPERALIFSNYADRASHVGPVEEACSRHGIALDVVGRRAGSQTEKPEQILGKYDVVFAKGRCALEAAAVGAAVILCDERGLGGMVTAGELERLRRLNFGARTLQRPHDPEAIATEIGRYDTADAATVTDTLRETAGVGSMVDALLEVYGDAMEEQANHTEDSEAEARAVSFYFEAEAVREQAREAEIHRLNLALGDAAAGAEALSQELERLQRERDLAASELQSLGAAHAQAQADLAEARITLQRAQDDRKAFRERATAIERELDAFRQTLTVRLRDRAVAFPVIGRTLRGAARLARRLR